MLWEPTGRKENQGKLMKKIFELNLREEVAKIYGVEGSVGPRDGGGKSLSFWGT